VHCKIVLVGGGSLRWAPEVAADLFLTEGLDGGELVLVDIDKEIVQLMHQHIVAIAQKIGCNWKVPIQDLEPALDGADAVVVSISTGGVDAMLLDTTTAERFGIYHGVGDTMGPAGISRTLRSVPVFVDIARKMEKRCPDAWMVNVTNPLSQLTRCVWKTTGIRCVGLCHNYHGTMVDIADFLGVDYSDLEAVSVGVNHYTWLKDFTWRGEDIGDRLSLEAYIEYEKNKGGQEVITGTIDDQIEKELQSEGDALYYPYQLNFELYELFGVFPVGRSPHLMEGLPWYANDWRTIRKHGIRPKSVPKRVTGVARLRREFIEMVESGRPVPEPKKSAELVAPVIESLCTGKPSRGVVCVPNEGQITNLPRDVIVETWAKVERDSIQPVPSGPMPDGLLGLMQLVVDEEELAVEAALTGDRRKVAQAMYVSPMVQNKDRAAELADALIAATKEWLPQF